MSCHRKGTPLAARPVVTRTIAAVALGVWCFVCSRGVQARTVADTPLVDQRGVTFTLQELRGAPVVVTFVATRCTDACPVADAIFAQLASYRVGARLVTITLDPRYDTPFVMSRYARDLHAQAPQWRLASGSPAALEGLLRAFAVNRIAMDEHSTLVYCLNARGQLVKEFPLSTATVRDIRSWLTHPR